MKMSRYLVTTLLLSVVNSSLLAQEPEPSQGEKGFSVLGHSCIALQVADAATAAEWYQNTISLGVDPGIGFFTDQALNARSFVFREPCGNRLQIFAHCENDCE